MKMKMPMQVSENEKTDESGLMMKQIRGEDESDEDEELKNLGLLHMNLQMTKSSQKQLLIPAWEPIGQQQTGEHVSLYDGKSADWNEKNEQLPMRLDLPDRRIDFLEN